MGRSAKTDSQKKLAKKFGLFLSSERKKRKLTQQQLANILDMDLDALRGLEQGRYAHPSFFTTFKLIEALRIRWRSLVDILERGD